MATNDNRGRPSTGATRPRREGPGGKSEAGTRSRNKLRTVTANSKAPSSTNLRATSSSRMAKASSSNGNSAQGGKNVLGSRSQNIEVKGWSISLRMAMIFGVLISVMVFVSLMLLNTFMKSKLVAEVKASGVKASIIMGMTGQIISKVDDIMIKDGLPNSMKVELNNYYKEVAAKLNNDEVNILCVSLRNPTNKNEAVFQSYSQYNERDFKDAIPEIISGVEMREGTFILSNPTNKEEIPAYKFESKILDNNKKLLGYSVIFISFKDVKQSTDRITKITFIVAFVGALVGFGVSWLFARTLSEPILKLVRDIQIVAEGDLEHKTKARSRDEIGVLAMAFNSMTENLKKQQQLEVDAEIRNVELSHAKDIQQRLLPHTTPTIKGFEFWQRYTSAKEVGGDYYDIMPIDANNIALLVADVSGKGIPGSMVMAETRTILRIIHTKNLSPKSVMMQANHLLAQDIKPGMFVTMMYCVLNFVDKTLNIASAGHNPIIIMRMTGECLKLNPKGIALGFDKGPIFNRVIAEHKIQLLQGDRVVMYTDGVVESMNENREEYTEERLEEFVRKNFKLTSKAFGEKLISDLQAHQGDAEQHDDITILTFRVL